MDADRVGDVAARAPAAGSRPGRSWRIDVPGEKWAAIPPLAAAGFRPPRLAPLFASGPIGRCDRDVIHDEDLL